jgi:hypothetical protein
MVRPIDAQQIILQTNSVEKIQQLQQQHPGLQQQYIELQIKEEKKLARETVQDAAEAEKAEIKDKDKDKERNKRKLLLQNKNKKPGNQDGADVDKDKESKEMGLFVDIKV